MFKQICIPKTEKCNKIYNFKKIENLNIEKNLHINFLKF